MISDSGTVAVSPDIAFQYAPVEQHIFLLAAAAAVSLYSYHSVPDNVFPVPLFETAVEICSAAPDAAAPDAAASAFQFEIDRPFLPAI